MKATQDLLERHGVPVSFSYYPEEEPGGLVYEDEDGYCKGCRKDFGRPGLYCSTRCARRHQRLQGGLRGGGGVPKNPPFF